MSSSGYKPRISSERTSNRLKPSSLSKTSSSSKRTQRAKEHWTTGAEDSEDSDQNPPARQIKPKKRKAEPPLSRPSFIRKLFFAILRSILYPLLPYLVSCGLLYLAIAYARYLVYSYFALLPAFLQPRLSGIANFSLPVPELPHFSFSALTCTTIGHGCRTNLNLVSGAARRAAYKGQQALTIFDHLLSLNDEDSSNGLALHPVEIWELSTAIRYSSGIADKEFISTELASLGDSVREVKDSVIGLNAQGMNAFIWIVHEFSRLEEAISRAASSPKRSKKQEAELERLLEGLFDKISLSLGDLLVSLDQAIPVATVASDKSRRIFGTLRAEESQTERELSEKSWIDWMKQVQGSKGKQLRKDLALTRGSAEAVVGVWETLEGTRESLLGYRNNVGYFKAGVVGFHLSSHDLSVEDEVSSLRTVMKEMKATLDEARSNTRRSSRTDSTVKEIGSS